MEGGNDKVVLLGYWSSSYAIRVKVALAEKKVEYKDQEENLADKSTLVLESNPVHKKIPILIHNSKPICESLNIVEYIDEVWTSSSPLLPSDPYLRSHARFWADFIDKKIYEGAKKLWRAKGEEQQKIIKEFIESLKLLEGELNDKTFFGGDQFGYVDVALMPITSWFYTLEQFGNFSIKPHCPKLISWVERCKERPSVANSLPDPEKVYNFALDFKRKYGTE